MSFDKFVLAKHPTGSSYICNPPVTDTDVDTVILVLEGYENALNGEGFNYQFGEVEYETCGEFCSWRGPNKANYIITQQATFYNKFVAATEAAKALNLTVKEDRIALFQKVLYNQYEV